MKQINIAVIDIETDPFKFGRVPKPFACGVMINDDYKEFWGIDCVERAVEFLGSLSEPHIIYAHNGGKFDFFYLLVHLQNPIKIINGRIVKAKFGIHEFRDSWSIIPLSLKNANKKDDIDYQLFEKENREKHKREILDYLHSDCEYLRDMCVRFYDRFGLRLTIGGTSARELRKLHPQQNGNERHDKKFREFYFGGRVECFKSGVLKGDFKIYDVNSMYPYVMKSFRHPKGTKYENIATPKLDSDLWIKGFPEKIYFAEVEGINKGGLPIRVQDSNGGLSFSSERGVFKTNSHELRAAIKNGFFRPTKILRAFIPQETQSFAEFVNSHSKDKIEAKKRKDKISETFAKLIMNSSYGRFAIDPENFYDYYLEFIGVQEMPEDSFELYQQTDYYRVWRKPSPSKSYEDVSVAASITGASRAVLLSAISNAVNPIYCDTDSLICQELKGVKIDDTELGAWKFEGACDTAAIAGKKMYALFNKGELVKSASKGVKLNEKEILKIANGGEFIWKSDSPNFSLRMNMDIPNLSAKGVDKRFIQRLVRSTA